MADDYPDWTALSYERRGPEKLLVGLGHRTRALEIGVLYTQWSGFTFTSEQVLKTDAPFPEGSADLLDYLEQEYASVGYTIDIVEAGPEGSVRVDWHDPGGPFSGMGDAGTDFLGYDGERSEWRRLSDYEVGM